VYVVTISFKLDLKKKNKDREKNKS